MQQHNLVQGSPEWKAHRAKYNNASDTPAVLGLSKYKTRTELMTERKTGLVEDPSKATQELFDDGHRYERLARPIAAQIVGKSLYPVTGTDGEFGASFDGLTMSEDIAFEHKTLNNAIRECNSIDDLDEMYLVQMEHQLMVAGAEKCLFMATKWDANDNLLEQKYFWYFPDAERRQRILDAWAQFATEEADFVPVEVIEKPKAEVVIELPALFIQAHGAILNSNMEAYGTALAIRLAEVRSIALITDQDFSNAKEGAKRLRENIKQANLAKDAMLEQTATVGEAARMIDAWCEDMRLTALQLEKDVEREDKAKKLAMVTLAKGEFTEIVNSLEDKVRPIRLNIAMPDFDGAIKGKSKFSSMQDGIDTLTASATINAKTLASQVLERQNYLKDVADGYEFLFSDLQQIIFKADDDFQLLVTTRIKAHQESEAEKEAKIKKDAEAALIAKQEAEKVTPVTTNTQSEDAPNKIDTGDCGSAPLNPAPVNHIGDITNITKPVAKIQYFAGVSPTVNEIVSALATVFAADEDLTHKWLIEADFMQWGKKAA